MRAIHWARLDKRRPVLVLTRELMVGRSLHERSARGRGKVRWVLRHGRVV
ncbi:MAG: hypothetical protein ACYCO3_02305 [Mycobacteriales bacterium]